MSNAFWNGVSERAVALRATARDSSWIILGKVLIFALSFLFITALANLAPASVIGSYNFIMSILTIISITTLAGMNTALIRAVARGFEGSVRSMMRLKFLWGLLGSAISLATGIFYFFQGNHAVGLTFIIASPLVPMTDTYSEMAYSFFIGRKNFKKSTLLAVLCQAMFSIPTIIVLFFSHNLIIISVSFFAFQALAGITTYSFINPKNGERERDSEILGYHLTIMGALRTIATNIDTVIVWILAGPFAVAVYTFATTPMDKVEQLIPLDTVSLPDLSKQPATKKLKREIAVRTTLFVALMIPLIVIGYFVTPFVFHLLFSKFPASIPLFRILLLTLLTTPFILPKAAMTAWGETKLLYTNEIIFPIVKITLMLILGIEFGMIGVVMGLLISRYVEAFVLTVLFANVSVA